MARPLRVLLVEDSIDDAELIEIELIRGGFAPTLCRVETADRMAESLVLEPWDLVLSDFDLPKFSAGGALEVLRASGRDIPFIILSGVVKAEEAIALMKLGAHDFLDKGALIRLVPAIEREMKEAVERRRRLEAEEQVRILSMAVEQSPVAVMITDTDGIITYVNPQFCQTSGYDRAEVLGRTPRFLKAPHIPGENHQEMWRTIQAGQVWRGMFHNRRKDGAAYWDESSVSPVRNANGRISHYVGLSQDVTERQNRDMELVRAVERLAAANTELERFAFVASHDLQEPLRTLISFTQLLERSTAGRLDDDPREYMEFIVGAASRMRELIGDLLDYSRLQGAERPFDTVALGEACASALVNLQASIDESGAKVTVGALPKVTGDAVQMMQLFQNLIGNAVKFHHPGQVPEVAISAEWTASEWTVSVADNGIGIPPTSQDIFEIFRRLHTQAQYPGTGVGLAVCKCIVLRHGGRIWVDPRPGGGSIFRFTLPAG